MEHATHSTWSDAEIYRPLDPVLITDSNASTLTNDSWLKREWKSASDDEETQKSDDHKRKEHTPTEVLSEHAERFRMRLIRHFRLLENLNEMELILETPKLHASDITDKDIRMQLLEKNPYALIKFNTIRKRVGTITKQERRWKRIRCRETTYPPLDLWANWVVESNIFQNCMLGLIVLNAVMLVVDAEIGEIVKDESSKQVVRVLRTLDYCCLWVFVLEIFLKWIDDFKTFWKNGWNELDFYITLISILPEVITWLTTKDQLTTGSTLVTSLSFLRVLRITRLLKMVSRFEQARIILMSVSKAFSAMTFILLLLALFMWMFALIGQVIFQRYTQYDGKAEGIVLLYQTAFSDILWSFATLFQLMTLDHWLETLTDMLKVMADGYESTITVVFILSWIWVGSFVFKNIFAGIMVNNFQTIRNDLHWEKKEKEAKSEVDKFKKEFTDEVLKAEHSSVEGSTTKVASSKNLLRKSSHDFFQTSSEDLGVDKRLSIDERSLCLPHLAGKAYSALSLFSQLSVGSANNQVEKGTLKKVQWDNVVQRHMDMAHLIPGEVVWSRDVLFKYYQAMEMIQENLKERSSILKFLNLALLQIHDR